MTPTIQPAPTSNLQQPPQPQAPLLRRAVIHDRYDLTFLPRHPGPGWTRFVCISDTHSHTFHVPPGDVLLHAGDLSRHGTLKDLEVTLNWMKELPHPAKFFMAGNHDLCLDNWYAEDGPRPRDLRPKDVATARKLVRSHSMLKAGMRYIEHEAVTYIAKSGKTYTIYGSPAAPFYSIGAFQYSPGEGREIYSRIPPSVDILMTHTPAHGICDLTRRGKHAGCAELAERLMSDDLRNCRLHVFGHIHEAHGVAVVGQCESNPDGRISVNAALPSIPLPIIVDLED
ncbi:Metallo-dependent phosphatase [Cubamyces lactineus]|nr:Metallo-dependent phosphatase [Cubamyces lactineus]